MFRDGPRFDAPFWGLLLTGISLVSCGAFFGLASAAQRAAIDHAPIITVSDPVHAAAAAAPEVAQQPSADDREVALPFRASLAAVMR